MNLPAYVQCSQQGEYILLFGTNLCINFKITPSVFKNDDRNVP